jgi:hypothetical protein
VNTGNRTLWIAVGAVLTAAGVIGALASLGQLSWLGRDRTLLGPEVARRWHTWHPWAVAAVIVAGLVVAVLGFLLLRAQLRGRGGAPMPDLVSRSQRPVPAPEEREDEVLSEVSVSPGRTRVSSGALQQSLVRDLRANRAVRRVAVRLVGDREHPEALVRLSVTADADVTGLRSHMDSALDRFTTTSGVRPRVRDVVVTMADKPPARVH